MQHQTIADDIWKIEVPLPGNPLRATNAYLIRGGERNLLIDTGFNNDTCHNALQSALTSLDAAMGDTDIFVTHMHADHSGLIGRLTANGTRVFMSRADGQVTADSRNAAYWTKLQTFFALTGLASLGLVDKLSDHPGYEYSPTPVDIEFIENGAELRVGDYRFVCIETKGHTAGHMCLYEPEKRLLFSGDHVLGRITPNITLVDLEHDMLAEYLRNLDAVAALDVERTHPGHRQSIDDCRARIAELKRHHEDRLREAVSIVSDRPMSAVDVAGRMKWSISYPRWDDFPPAQKLFSTGEALSHLFHLVNLGALSMRRADDGVVYFEKCAGRV